MRIRSTRTGGAPSATWPSAVPRRKRQKTFATARGDEHLVFELHAVRADVAADVALDAEDHSCLQDAVIARPFPIGRVRHRWVLVTWPDTGEQDRVTIGQAIVTQARRSMGERTECPAWPEQFRVQRDLLFGHGIEAALLGGRGTVAGQPGL